MFSYTKKTLIASLFALFISFGIVDAFSVAYVSGIDTTAGMDTLIKATNFPSGSQIVFVVTTPDGSQIQQIQKADLSGTANATFDGLHTQKSGIYKLYAKTLLGEKKSLSGSFTVHPADMSLQNSALNVNKKIVVADGKQKVEITVKLVDKYKNPLKGHAVKIFSNRKVDSFSPSISLSDDLGVAKFSFTPSLDGLVTLMALDTTSGQILEDRASLSLLKGEKMLMDVGGDYPAKAHAAVFGPLNGFEIDSIPDSVNVNENVTFTVKAVDKDSVVVEDYTGTIRFSAEGENGSAVKFPDNYKFLATDLGTHTFSLGLSFAEKGTYKLVVSDVSDKFKMGEKTVVVGDKKGGNLSGDSSEDKPTIAMPAAGFYSQAEQTITGTAKAGTNAKIFDNDKEIGVTQVGSTGRFSYKTPPLSDGKHVFRVEIQDKVLLQNIGVSDPVEITIDTTPPKIEELKIEPKTKIVPGSVVNVSVYSEKNLSQAALIFNYDIIELNAKIDDSSVYVGTLQAPAEPGEYKVSILLVDELQNEITYQDFATVNVSLEGGTIKTEMPKSDDKTKKDDAEEKEEKGGKKDKVEDLTNVNAPSQVSGLIAYGLDGRVTLVWDAAIDDGFVQFYRVYYGDSVQNLSQMVETRDASTTWYIPNLQNGKEYFFSVTAVDNDGNESINKSEIVSGIPFVMEINNKLSETIPKTSLEQPNLHSSAYDGPLPSKTTSSGPELLFLLGGVSSTAALIIRKRRK